MTVEINVTSDVKEWSKALTRLQKKQLPFATALAVQKTAIQARDEANKEITRKVDRPTAFTKRATIATGPNERLDRINQLPKLKRLPRATVKLRDEASGGNPPSRYLEAIVFGKSRTHKGYEKQLIRMGIMREDEYSVPGDDLKLSKSSGNIPRGAIVAMLSQLQVNPDPMQNATGSARSKSKRRSKAYFVMYAHGFRGVMVRTSKTAFTSFLAFVKRPSYRRRIQWNRRVEDTIRFRWSRNFTQSLAKALRTAR